MSDDALQTSEAVSDQGLLIRKAHMTDVSDMFRIINYYADRQLMLPKTQLQLYENLRDFSVITGGTTTTNLIGCGALHIYWENLAEIRAIAVKHNMVHKGVGTRLVERLLAEAKELEIERVFLFTYEPDFFRRFGFIKVEHSAMPLKVYNECFNCPKFTKCDEIAMVLHL